MKNYASIDARLASFRSWPFPSSHPTLSAAHMAMAGFYHNPSLPDSPDNVACFVCGKNLDGWDGERDVAWTEHVKHGSKCSLMANAGFFFYPKEVDDDTVYCVQCGCCLGGWEPTDDPRKEHARRFPRCPYLATGTIMEPAAFQRILASSSERYIKNKTPEKKKNNDAELVEMLQGLIESKDDLSLSVAEFLQKQALKRLDAFDQEAGQLMQTVNNNS